MVTYGLGGMVIDYRYFDLVNVVFFLFAGIIIGYRAEPKSSESRTALDLPASYPASA